MHINVESKPQSESDNKRAVSASHAIGRRAQARSGSGSSVGLTPRNVDIHFVDDSLSPDLMSNDPLSNDLLAI